MKLLGEICLDKDVKCECFKFERNARAVILNDKGEIALTYEVKPGMHLLAGGGVEKGENFITACKRECLEEVGANVEIMDEVGAVLLSINGQGVMQLCECFVAKVKGKLQCQCLTEGEQDAGIEIHWMGVDEAIKVFESERKKPYKKGGYLSPESFQKFQIAIERELMFLREYQKSGT